MFKRFFEQRKNVYIFRKALNLKSVVGLLLCTRQNPIMTPKFWIARLDQRNTPTFYSSVRKASDMLCIKSEDIISMLAFDHSTSRWGWTVTPTKKGLIEEARKLFLNRGVRTKDFASLSLPIEISLQDSKGDKKRVWYFSDLYIPVQNRLVFVERQGFSEGERLSSETRKVVRAAKKRGYNVSVARFAIDQLEPTLFVFDLIKGEDEKSKKASSS